MDKDKIRKILKKDKYPEMTEEAVNTLWNNQKYSTDGLLNIALALILKLQED